MPSYHDLHITTKDIPRTSIFNLPYNMAVICTRTGGWELWDGLTDNANLIAAEYCGKGLKLDVDGVVIVDSFTSE